MALKSASQLREITKEHQVAVCDKIKTQLYDALEIAAKHGLGEQAIQYTSIPSEVWNTIVNELIANGYKIEYDFRGKDQGGTNGCFVKW